LIVATLDVLVWGWPWINNCLTMPPTPQGPNLVWAKKLSRKELGLMDEIIQRGVKDIKVG
jgi:hypothetical protein